MKNLVYIQRKANVSNVLWAWCNGLGMSHYPVKYIYKGHQFGNTIWVCKKDVICFAADETSRFDDLMKDMQEEILKDPEHVTRIRAIFDKRAEMLLRFVSFLKKTNLLKLPNKKLAEAYKGIVDCYKDVYPYGEPIAFVSKNFADVIEQYLVKEKHTTKDEFHALITPIEKSFMHDEQQALLEIALKVKGNKITKKIKDLLKEHTDRFIWIPYDYGANHYTLEYFTKELKRNLEKGDKELKKELNDLKNYSANMKKKHEQLFKKYKVDAYHKRLFKVVQDCYYLMDYKKGIFTQLHWYSANVFYAIQKRLRIKKEHVQYLLPYEVKNLLLGKEKPDRKRLEARYNAFVLVVKASGKTDTIEGKKAEEIVGSFYKDGSEKEDVKSLSGRGASPGNVRGKVRIIMDAKKCGEMKKGEVLVTAMTSPDFMPAVRKAIAIVTDEGGVTCHAAIVARELNIPCVVGTKMATKILKNSDVIEVRGCHGSVEIIKKVK